MAIDYVQGDNVISIRPTRTRTLFPALGTVETYWEALRNGRLMPARAEIDPRGIAGVLEYAFVLEKIAPGLARIRLAGMHLNELMAMEVRGMPITAMFLPEARRELERVLEQVMEAPAVVRLSLGSDTGFTRPPLDAQMLLLPLRDDRGRVTRILGALQTRGEIGRGPRRFLIRDIETKPLMDDPLTRARPDLAGFERLPEPRPALHTVGTDAFAPRTAELARQIAARQKARADTAGQTGLTEDVDHKRTHLRLVHDADQR